MTKERFEKLWDMCERNNHVEFVEHGEQYMLSWHKSIIGGEYVLEKFDGHTLSTVLIHWSKSQFERMLAF